MRAIDVMVRDVVTVHPETDVAEAIRLLTEHDVSALPVVDPAGNLVGVLSEADLIHRVEIGTEKRRPWWREAVTGASTLAADFAKSHGKKVGEVMTPGGISVSEDTPLSEIATLFERKGIKRVPVGRDGKLVGIGANLIQALASVVGRNRPARRNGSADQARADVSAAAAIVERFRQPQRHGQRRRRASVGARWLAGGTQGLARARGNRARSVSGLLTG